MTLARSMKGSQRIETRASTGGLDVSQRKETRFRTDWNARVWASRAMLVAEVRHLRRSPDWSLQSNFARHITMESNGRLLHHDTLRWANIESTGDPVRCSATYPHGPSTHIRKIYVVQKVNLTFLNGGEDASLQQPAWPSNLRIAHFSQSEI